MAASTNNYEVAGKLHFRGQAFDFLAAFLAEPALTPEQLRDMPEALRAGREQAFYGYVEALTGDNPQAYILPGSEARRLNTAGCPVQAFVTVSAQAKLGTAWVVDTGEAAIEVPAGTSVRVAGKPASAMSKLDGWYDVTDDPESAVRLSTDNPFTYESALKDTILEARFNEVATVEVVVENLDGKGSVSGGGTVRMDEAVFISTVGATGLESYRFSGWFVKGTDTLVTPMANYYYHPDEAHVADDGKIYLEARFSVVMTNAITLSATSITASGYSITANAQYPVASVIVIEGEVWDDVIASERRLRITIPVGGLSASQVYLTPAEANSISIVIENAAPSSDDTYEYLFGTS